jgi:NitT/TauT family transport system substrate-binding protein
LSEEDSWDDLQTGRIAATATTVDVLANYGRQWQGVVPAQIAWSRGADGLIVRKEIRRINDLAGRRVATAPFSEAEFFIRYLAQEAGLPVKRLDGPDSPADPRAVNLVFLEDAFAAGDAFLADLKGGGGALDGCVTWAPKTTEVVRESGGRARQLVDNKNLLIIADVLVMNKAFAAARPDVVKVLVEGMLLHNQQIRDNPEAAHEPLAKAFAAFKWTPATAAEELAKVHLSNLPENLAFFEGKIDEAGSFAGIFQSANLAYGPELQPNPVAASYFASLDALQAVAAAGRLAGQVASIQPIRSSEQAPIEQDPLLTRDIRFFFLPNDHKLDMAKKENLEFLASVKRLLEVSPGSMVLMRGHVDDARREEFRRQGGEALVRTMALKAMELSTQRADEVKVRLLEAHPGIDPKRVELIGRGWEEPSGKDPDLNRRVEVQWFTLE